uniref:Uncharacterized protein n=1 Tax=Caenorhabditis japonica TaxID=281687 RepID=A0A8R1EEV5_CAEJA
INLTSLKVAKYIVFGWFGLFFAFVLCIFVVHDGELDYNSNSVIHLFLDDFDSDEYIGEWLVDLCTHIRSHPGTRSLIVTIVPPLIFYAISVVSYLFIIQLLCSRRKISAYHRHWGSMFRLGIHLLLFAGTCALTGSAYLGSFTIGHFCEQHNTNEPMCLEAVLEYMRNTAAALLGWMIRMIIDATVDTVDIACFLIIHAKVSCNKNSTTAGGRKTESVHMEALIRKSPRAKKCRLVEKKSTTIIEEELV